MEEKTIWYWEYTLTVWDEDEEREVSRSGIVAAFTMAEAMKSIEDFYGEEIMSVDKLKPITDIVMDFDLVNCIADFDYRINRK